VFVLLVSLSLGCQRELSQMAEMPVQTFQLKLSFKPVADGVTLEYNKSLKNHMQETYSVSAFKFYITRVRLVNGANNTGSIIGENEHFLIDASSATTSNISIKALPGQYDQLEFMLGVDSIRNVSGSQTGALDPTNGMFWTWNSGYIMAKLEGISPVSNQPNQRFEYHIGGFKGEENVARKIILSFPQNQPLSFLPGTANTINLSANVNAWFNGPNNISIAANPVCMTPGALAKKVAENYSGMFTITDIVNN
jgi:hypothetical protein